jgi:hypothetical protein
MDKSFNIIQWLISEYKALAMFGLVVIFCFPLVTTGILWMERTGYFKNVYQVEHQMLRDISTRGVRAAEQNNSQLKTNYDLIRAGTYYQQRTCVNTAKTQDEKEKCIHNH